MPLASAAVDRLQVLVVERLLPQDRGDARRRCPCRRSARAPAMRRLGVLVVLAAEAHEQVRDGLAEQLVFLLAARLQLRELLFAGLLELVGLRAEAIGLRVIERPHVRLGHRGDRAQDALLAAARAGAVARDQRVVVPPHHQHVAQRRGLRILRPRVVVEAEILLRRVGQQVEERGAAFVLGVDLLGFLHHPQRLVLAAGRDARRAPLAEVRDEDREDAARRRASSSQASRRSRWPSGTPSAPCR